MKLFIDNQEAELDRKTVFAVSLSLASVSSPAQARTGYTKSIEIPMTPRNRKIMGFCEEVHARDRFNSDMHYARIEENGSMIMEGKIELSACERSASGIGKYVFNIIGSGKEWAEHASSNSISSLNPYYSVVLNGQVIQQSWTGNTPVRFLPVQRESYILQNSSESLMPAERVLSAVDYHPFINLRWAVKMIFSAAGFTVRSEFIDGDWFASLYMSGRYAERNVKTLKDRMDFKAGRFAESSASADGDGRVYANPYALYNTIGNIVDTADPKETRNGVALEGVFTNNGCFSKVDGELVFKPLYEISAGFEYKFRYVTDYRIISEDELQGFNSIYLGGGDLRTFKIANRYPSRKKEFRANKIFRCIVPGGESKKFRLTAWRITNPEADPENLRPGDYTLATIATFDGGNALVSTTVEGTYLNLNLEWQVSYVYVSYLDAWALYDGYVEEQGKTEVEITLRSAPETLKPSQPKKFLDIYFGGAKQGMNLTLKEAWVRPVFMPHPAEGAKVEFADLTAYGFSRQTLLNALRQMFNLCFYTDNLAKEVYIEPRGQFWGDTAVDWSGKIDRSKPYRIEEVAAGMPRTLTFRYLPAAGAAARATLAEGGTLGAWIAETGNSVATVGNEVYENAMFSPSVNSVGCLPSAMSASWLQVGDQDAEGDFYSEELNFATTVVRYLGMEPLPEGEKWGWPLYGGSYPLLAFHNPDVGERFTLCFEDRDGLTGLHRFWDGNIETYRNGCRLTVWLRLEPHEVEPFLIPNRLEKDFRALFRLKIEGERSQWRLEEICDYNPAAISTKCVFVKEV